MSVSTGLADPAAVPTGPRGAAVGDADVETATWVSRMSRVEGSMASRVRWKKMADRRARRTAGAVERSTRWGQSLS